jgi:hypothetical protein
VSMPMGWTIRADRSLWQPCWREIASRHNAMVQQHHRESPSMAGRHTGARGIPALDGLQLRELFPEASGIADPPFLLWRRGGTFEPAQVLLLWKWAVPLLLQGRAGFARQPLPVRGKPSCTHACSAAEQCADRQCEVAIDAFAGRPWNGCHSRSVDR